MIQPQSAQEAGLPVRLPTPTAAPEPDRPQRLVEPLERVAQRFGPKIALRLRKSGELRTLTYAALVEKIHAAAAALLAAGLRPGDRVVVFCENSPDWPVAYFGVSAALGTVVPLDAGMSAADLPVLLKAADPRLVLVSRALAARLAEAGPPAPVLVIEDGLSVEKPAVPTLAAAKDDPDADPELASILFTSGTSGRPKGVMLTHANLLYAGMEGIVPLWGVTDADELLMVLPLHHIFGFIAAMSGTLTTGATITFVEAVRGDLILAAMQETHSTILPGVPRLFELFWAQIKRQVASRGLVTRIAFRVMRFVTRVVRARTGMNPGPAFFKPIFKQFGGARLRMVTAGAPIAKNVLLGLESLGFPVLEGYGMTETTAAATGSTFADRRPSKVGHALDGLEVQIHQPNTAGEGEVCIRGRGLMRGYFREPEMTAGVVRDGWYHTGDLGRLNRAGYLSVIGRLDELIVTPAGKKASPDDVERHYLGIEGAKELAVLGMPCGDRPGEEIHAAVVVDKALGLPEEELRRMAETAVAERAPEVASHLRVQRVHFVEEIPKTTKLTVRRKELRKLLQSRRVQTPSDPASDAPAEAHDALEERVLALVSQVSTPSAHRSPTSLRSSLQFDLGIDSLGRAELMSSLEEEFGLAVDALGPSVHRVADLVAAVRQSQGDGEPLVGGKDDGATAPVPPPRGWFAKSATEIILWATRVVWHIDVDGLENLPEKGPYLLCPNHLTNLDGIWLAAVLPRAHRLAVCAFAKEELWRFALGRFLAGLGRSIPVRRDGDTQPALRAGLKVLESGRPLMVFPEGTRSRSGELASFRRGAARMALSSGVPIVPVRLVGTYEVYGTHRKLPKFVPRFFKRVRLQVVVGEPIVPPPLGERTQEAELALTGRLRQAVAELG